MVKPGRVGGKAFVITLQLDGARETLRAFRDLPPEASKELRQASGRIADRMVVWISSAARRSSRQSALLASTVRRLTDRVPAVAVGGTKSVTTGLGVRVPAYKLLFGANFGASVYPQFRPHRGRGEDDYFVWVQMKEHRDEINREWDTAADAVIKKWSEGGEA